MRESKNCGVTVGGLCTAAHLLAAAGLLTGKRCAIHWENLPGFSEKFSTVDVYADLYEMDGNIWTCAGGTAALDMMLSLIGQDFDEELVNRVCEQALTDRVRTHMTANDYLCALVLVCKTPKFSQSLNLWKPIFLNRFHS